MKKIKFSLKNVGHNSRILKCNGYIKEGEEFAILTNIIHQEWSGLSVKPRKSSWERI